MIAKDELKRIAKERLKDAEAHFAEWSEVARWNPEARYKAAGATTRADAENLVGAARTLLGVL